MDSTAPMSGHFDPTFVCISFVIALLSAYAALDLTGRVTSSRSRALRFAWLGGGATAMGLGIWSMHYVGMLAFRMPMPVLYDWPTVLLSMFAAVIASAVALSIAARKTMGTLATVAGSVAMGGGISAMHYIGMAAMRMAAIPIFSWQLVTLSIALAIGSSFAALRIIFAARKVSTGWTWRKGLSAVIMGLAIPAMHYTGMAAASWKASVLDPRDLRHAISISDLGGSCVALASVIILSLVFLAAIVDRRFSDHASEMEGSEQRYHRIIASAFDAFIGLTSEGKIIDWNTQASATFGWAPEEAIGRSISEVLLMDKGPSPSEERDFDHPQRGGLLAEGRTEMQARHRTGLLFPVEVAVSAIQTGGKQQIAAFVRDVTERKAIENKMEEARASAEAANRAKSQFLANMSHEIRTPLNGVIGMTDLALETELTEEQRDYIETVKLSADALLDVINDILDFSKIEARKVELEDTAFDLRECIESTLKTLALRADEKGLELLCDIAPEIPEIISGDPARLRQIVTNLIGNAVKFTGHGEVSVKIVADQNETDPVLHFIVSDTGIGIAPDKLETIFESFHQADASTTRQYGGTGLGLTISRRLVDLMGGRMWVTSQSGQGSEFHFVLPRRGTVNTVLPVNDSGPRELTGVKVLIIDDNKTNRRILEGVLTRWGMHCTSAAGGEEALRMLGEASASADPYRLILTDMHMPKMDGFMLVKELHKDDSFSAATVMMLSSGGHRGDTARCQDLGIAAYLLKPVRQAELRAAIVRALGATSAQEERMITQESLQADRPASDFLDILLAEDNEVNQKVAVRLLEKRGHKVTVVGNGRQAVQALASRPFDLVLMDVQMPEMDGIEATAAIRAREEKTGLHQAIVAMTALVMKGDYERCLDAKMDGYLAKPVRQPELDQVLETYTQRKRADLANGNDTMPSLPMEDRIIDTDELMAMVDGDLVFVAELIEVFRNDCPCKLTQLCTALAANDAKTVRDVAHALKGALGNLSATRAAGVAAQVEKLGADNKLVGMTPMLRELELETDRAIEALTAMCGAEVR